VPIVIDDGITEYPVEPRNGAFLVAHFSPSFQAPYKRRLQYVLCGRPGFDAGLQKVQKLPVTIYQPLDRRRRQGMWFLLSRHEASLSRAQREDFALINFLKQQGGFGV